MTDEAEATEPGAEPTDQPAVVEHATVFEAFLAVADEVRVIEKRERNREQGFFFRGIDTTVEVVGPVLRKHGLFVVPDVLETTVERYNTRQNTAMKNVTVKVRFTVHNAKGETFCGTALGEAADAGDKAASKAQSVAYRVFLLNSLTIPTRETDPDATCHERRAKGRGWVDPQIRAAQDELAAVVRARDDVTLNEVAEQFADEYGIPILHCTELAPLRAYIAKYRQTSDSDDEPPGHGDYP